MNRDGDQLRFPAVRKIMRAWEQRRVDQGSMAVNRPMPAKSTFYELNDGWKFGRAPEGAADDAGLQFREPPDI